GTGAGSPCRRATRAATARTNDESAPPEKLTTHGGRRSGASTARSSSVSGSRPGTTPAGTTPPGTAGPSRHPVATSSGVGDSAIGQRPAPDPEPQGRAEDPHRDG